MEAGSEGERKKPPEGESKSKRKMKTASQLEILEKTYAAEQYPSEASRAELSVQLGLSDRQLQMWFCHRRLKDRKGVPVKKPSKDFPLPPTTPGVGGEEMAAAEAGNEHALGSSLVTHSFIDSRRVVPRSGVALARIGGDVSSLKRYYEPQQSISELRAIAFLEGQLGEPLREDGPILGMEFDPLPPGAFGAPIGSAGMAAVGEQKQPERSFEAKLCDRPDAKIIKGAPRLLHEYQFLPEQPAVRNDTYERVGPSAASYHYGSPADGSNARTLSLSTGHTFLHANEQVPAGHSFSGHVPGLSLFPQQGRPGHLLTSSFEERDNILQKKSFPNIDMDVHLGAQPLTTLDNPVEKRVTPDDDFARVERRHKSEKARILREVEAHEKRIRKELEKQDILRRKREEQMRKEMERHDRERRKEEERLLREKQREEERYLREQRRELDRREKYLQKASIRAEKMRQKEELLREKEAARQKAATERAVARRMAKESMELMDDERLELMELAASSKGLPSMLSLDFETLQNLDVFRELTAFPPKSVRLKRPFSIKPWNDSEKNIGNLLMVWKFLINFADVLGLWPFTLDEFIQAFHDYDPRLLGEVHVSLLRSIVKDIEDVARIPATKLGVNQTSAANPGGGHPQIVEGAYTWGFSIRSWQRHLNPLTWPEILRQFALSAGFGPQLKQRVIEPAYLRDDNEDNDGEDIISNLRSGAAVENAVAIMQERGFSNPRRSRHCLTPGTVKFAAFHVLSFEGSKGLTIMEVAEKIQKSGLRDLTTSKTPEASIAAALSRDTKLFERTAPSTYCVRPAYRKDPTDAEAILSAARERIRIFKSGFVDGVDDAERDEDSESDIVKDPDVDDLNSDVKSKEDALFSQETNKFRSKVPLVNGKKSDTLVQTPESVPRDFSEGLPLAHSENLDEVKGLGAAGDQSTDVAAVSNDVTNLDQEDMDTDDSSFGEPWVQGLLEGEYSSLCVEERVNALVALIDVAIEGNSIRVALEERLEAANALKKQMWAEAQLDKRHMKEECVVKTHYLTGTGNKTEPNSGSLVEVRQSPLVTIGEKTNEMFTGTAFPQDRLSEPRNEMNFNIMPSEGNMQVQGFSNALASPQYQQFHTAENSRSQLKSLIGHKAEEMYVYRSLPLGQDRRRNRYWRFITSSSSNDPGCGRIFVELDDGRWRIIDCEEDFDTLLASLDVRGIQESHLHAMLQKIETSFKETVRRNLILAKRDSMVDDTCKTEGVESSVGPDYCATIDSPRSTVFVADPDVSETSTSFAIEIGRNENERSHALKEYRDFEEWMWKECYLSPLLCAIKYGNKRCLPLLTVCEHCHQIYCSEDSCCPSCYRTNGTCRSDVNFSEHMALFEEQLKADSSCSSQGSVSSPPRIRLLKLLISLIEVSILPEALRPVWTAGYRKSWCMKLYSAASAEELFQVLTLLERAVKGNYLSSNFETTRELLDSSELLDSAPSYSSFPEAVTVLPWLPQTTAAVALRVMEFDSSISYLLHHKAESQNDEGLMPSSKFAVVKNTQDDGTTEPPHSAGLLQEGNWIDVAVGFAGSGRGRGGRGRGRGRPTGENSQRNVLSSRLQSAKRSKAANSGTLGLMLGWKGGSRGRGGRKRGHRSIRSKQKQVKRVVAAADENDAPQEVMFEKLEPGFIMDEWNGTESSRLLVEDGADGSSSGRSEYDDQNGQAIGDEYNYLAVNDYTAGRSNGKSDDLPEGSEYNMDEDDNNEGLDDVEDEQEDLDAGRYINVDTDDGPVWDNGEQNRDLDYLGSTSSDFSQ
ncbi:homeobox-DDT domain protein RLT2-like isoform X2 [Tripterygium wilfordii]|uniref:homeobox-DDT domain protein RLT2-like isoform X2 n=1 Tax=Tripterygium wilfordii TaxID=458696 RepID=UPI0018F7EA59|nr:homeobox-DDT domain protein RLT2-like isoform X2 [Tripterygium wilfordii]